MLRTPFPPRNGFQFFNDPVSQFAVLVLPSAAIAPPTEIHAVNPSMRVHAVPTVFGKEVSQQLHDVPMTFSGKRRFPRPARNRFKCLSVTLAEFAVPISPSPISDVSSNVTALEHRVRPELPPPVFGDEAGKHFQCPFFFRKKSITFLFGPRPTGYLLQLNPLPVL